MHYVYGEEVIIVNFIGNFMILAAALLARNKRLSVFRCAAGAVIGVLYAFAAILWNGFMIGFPLKILMSLVMAAALSQPCTLKNVLLNAALIIFISFVSAGCILFLSFMVTSALYTEGGYIFSSNYALIFFGMLAGCFSVIQLYGVLNRHFNFDRLIYPCTVIHKGKIREVDLLADSGNLLKTVTGRNVVVLDHEIFTDLTAVTKTSFASYEEYEGYFSGLDKFDQAASGVIRARTIHSTQYLLVLKIDELHFQSGFTFYNIFAASGSIGHVKGGFGGIFNPILLKRRSDYEFKKVAQ